MPMKHDTDTYICYFDDFESFSEDLLSLAFFVSLEVCPFLLDAPWESLPDLPDEFAMIFIRLKCNYDKCTPLHFPAAYT